MATFFLLSCVLLPVAGAIGMYWVPERIHKIYMSLVAGFTFFTTLGLYFLVENGAVVSYQGAWGSPLGLHLEAESFGLLFAALSSFVWFAVTIFSTSYMDMETGKQRFYFFFLLTLAGTLGVTLSADLLTLLLFFELVSLAAYPLVVHKKTEPAYDAGKLYLNMAVAGGMALVLGMALVYTDRGTLSLWGEAAVNGGSGILTYLGVTLMVIGFGVKAGMVPLHIWLPKAHPVAPTPASALLSGIMIKTGIFGIIRVINMAFAPDMGVLYWGELETVGLIITFLGVATMLLGVFMALLQENMKKMLACHSVSQIGYILMGIGAAAYLGPLGSVGLGGAIYHTINHALFKGALFLVAGAVYFHTRELNLYRLGGLWKVMPFTAFIGLIASFGIAGVPLFNGYISKTILHHAIVEAAEYQNVRLLFTAERIFMLTGAGTACSFIKLYYLLFLKRSKRSYEKVKETRPMKVGMVFLGAAILFFGLGPNLVLERFIEPALDIFVLEHHHIEGHLLTLNFFNAKDLGIVAIALVGGFVIFFLGMRTGAFHLHLPSWMGGEYLGQKVGSAYQGLWNFASRGYYEGRDELTEMTGRIGSRGGIVLQSLDKRGGGWANFANLDFDLLLLIFLLLFFLGEYLLLG